MPLLDPITPGTVDWTGENPGILLKNSDGSFSAMALFFRVVWSPVGQGQVLLLYGTPGKIEGTKDAPNIMISDNMALAKFLKETFIAKLPAFRDAPVFDTLNVVAASDVRSSGDPMGHRYTETIASPEISVELVWEELEPPKALELSPDEVGTKEHTMFTLLVPARSAQIIVNGTALPGVVGERVQAGFKTTTAFLYFSETWITPPEVS
jgi:hypothetical protein